MSPQMLRAFLFDFDGTLADTEPLHLEAFRSVLGPLGVKILDEEYEARYLVGTDRECLERMFEDYARPDLRPLLDSLLAKKREAMDRLLDEAALFPGAAEFVERAAAVGPLAIVTGGLAEQVRGVLDRTGLSRHFVTLISAEDMTRGKPDPEGFRTGIARLDSACAGELSPAECLAVEDSPNGIAAARAAGTRTLALTHSTTPEALSAADVVATGYCAVELDDLLDRFR